MKQKIYFLLLLCSTGILFSCRSNKSVSFSVTQPAEITLPASVNTILLVDRTKFKNSTLNTIEGILTGEMPGDDKAAAFEALNSLKMQLDHSPRFSVKILPDRMKGNNITATFPDALSWKSVDSLCATNKSDVVVALEVFDSNFIITKGTRIKNRKEGEGKNVREVPYTEYYAQGVCNIKMGIRSYNPKTKEIIDQQMFTKGNTWEGAGATVLDAAAALISKSNANKNLARMVGEEYAYKISPMPITISRPFYGKSKHIPEVETGARYADVNKWEDAINIWKLAMRKADHKEGGKIAYNIAVAYEVMGEYGSALTWAQDAYTKYGNKDARYYVYSLESRIKDEEKLQTQMTR